MTPAILFFLLLAQPAFAYIDPGSGSMVAQLLLAGTVGLGVWLKMTWRRILAFLSPKKAQPQSSEPPSGN